MLNKVSGGEDSLVKLSRKNSGLIERRLQLSESRKSRLRGFNFSFTYANLDEFISFMNSDIHFQHPDNGVMRSPRSRKFNIISLVFITCLCFSKSLIIIIIIIIIIITIIIISSSSSSIIVFLSFYRYFLIIK